jgi:hypothetical protein
VRLAEATCAEVLLLLLLSLLLLLPPPWAHLSDTKASRVSAPSIASSCSTLSWLSPMKHWCLHAVQQRVMRC